MSYVHLETLKSLDRETTASYLLNISATASEQTQQVNGVYRGTLHFQMIKLFSCCHSTTQRW